MTDHLSKLSELSVQVPQKPIVATQQQLGSLEPSKSNSLTSGALTDNKPLTQTLSNRPIVSTGTDQVHQAYSNPVRSSSAPKPSGFTQTTKLPNVLKVADVKNNLVLGGAAGGLLGGLYGALNPGKEKDNETEKSRLSGALKGLGVGTVTGLGVAGAGTFAQKLLNNKAVKAKALARHNEIHSILEPVFLEHQKKNLEYALYTQGIKRRLHSRDIEALQAKHNLRERLSYPVHPIIYDASGNFVVNRELGPVMDALLKKHNLPISAKLKDPTNRINDAIENWAPQEADKLIDAYLNKQASVSLCRNTGLKDKDGNVFVNNDDALLLGKLGFIADGYGELTKTSEVLDLYSYIEKVAGVPKAVARAVDRGEAFSGSFLKDMEYSVPKGYEVKGDLCCPIEKKAAFNFLRLSNGTVIDLHNLSYMTRNRNVDYETLVAPAHIKGYYQINNAQSNLTNEGNGWGEYGSPKLNKSPQYTYVDDTGKKVGVVTGYHRPKSEHGFDGAGRQIRHIVNYYSPNAEKIDLPETFAKEIYDHLGGDDFAKLTHLHDGEKYTDAVKKRAKEKGFGSGISNNQKLVFDKHLSKALEDVMRTADTDWTNKPIGGPPPTLLQKLKPYRKAIGIGAGVTGLAALAYHLNKKKQEQSAVQPPIIEKESSEKTAKADPSQTILVTGHSGAGKSTLAKTLAEKLNLPLHRVDAQTSWDDLREHFEKNPEHERKALTPGSAEHKQYTKDVRKIVRKSLGEINGPAVLEGTQVTTLSPNQLSKYKASILVGGDMEQSIAQRLQRTIDKAAKKGITFTPEELAKKKEESKFVADSWHPGMEKFKKIPGVINYNHTEHKIEPLLEQLRTMMNKQAVAAWQRSEGKNPEGGLNAAGRCWEGYKPVPGKEPYSNDSCEPVGAKKRKRVWIIE